MAVFLEALRDGATRCVGGAVEARAAGLVAAGRLVGELAAAAVVFPVTRFTVDLVVGVDFDTFTDAFGVDLVLLAVVLLAIFFSPTFFVTVVLVADAFGAIVFATDALAAGALAEDFFVAVVDVELARGGAVFFTAPLRGELVAVSDFGLDFGLAWDFVVDLADALFF
ncbi:MAG: hypothetical protein ACR2PG_06945 [Hyphomicrobiaceae bacterium]